jgi:RNA recognition motif-containing protein
MGNELFVGNLPWGIDKQDLEAQLHQEFSKHGEVVRIDIKTDRDTGKVKFAFVEMKNDTEVDAVLTAHEENPVTIADRALNINRSRGKQEGGSRPFNRGGFGGGQRSGGFGGGQRSGGFGGQRSGGFGGGNRGGFKNDRRGGSNSRRSGDR